MTSAAYDSDEAFDQLMDDLQTIYTAKAGQVLTQDDVDSLNRLERHWEADGERVTDAYRRGWTDALRHAGGEALVEANERADKNWSEASAQKALRKFDMAMGVRTGAAACREMMARFVEQGGDAATAASIRANWNPEWGTDPAAEKSPCSIENGSWLGKCLEGALKASQASVTSDGEVSKAAKPLQTTEPNQSAAQARGETP